MNGLTLVWLRNDLRLSDNPALHSACSGRDPVVAVYVIETDRAQRHAGAAAAWWLGKSLCSLSEQLRRIGVSLLVEEGPAGRVVPETAKRLGASSVVWNRRYEPGQREVDSAVKAALKARDIAATSFPGNVLAEPWTVKTGGGTPFKVFSAFARAVREKEIDAPLPAPRASKNRAASNIEPTPLADDTSAVWTQKIDAFWDIGEAAARKRLTHFLDEIVADYPKGRDIPGVDGTSMLSPHLRFGEISARQIWHAATAITHEKPAIASAIDKFLGEIIWRDFNNHLLYHNEDISTVPMRPVFDHVRWRKDDDALHAWQRGETGIPIVDAGMRQLWETGWMHNRVRMLVASFLVKNLMIDWRVGEEWFWDTLVDADDANNPGNWQWVAGCGMDAAPYFRIFNPVLQGQKFDTEGDYVRQWVPEIAALPERWIHRPWEAPRDVLSSAGVSLGKTYPRPLVDLKASQARAKEVLSGRDNHGVSAARPS